MKTAALIMLLTPPTLVYADVVTCETGDQIHGKVLSVSETEVQVQSAIAGDLKIPREKVLTILFQKPAKPVISATGPSQPSTAITVPSPAQAKAPAVNLQEAVKSIDGDAVAKVQQDYLATASPEAQAMYREMVQGLFSGKLKMQDIRAQAQDTLIQLNDLGKELGDEDITEILGSYGAILQNFLNQTGGVQTNSLPAAESPALKKLLEEEE